MTPDLSIWLLASLVGVVAFLIVARGWIAYAEHSMEQYDD